MYIILCLSISKLFLNYLFKRNSNTGVELDDIEIEVDTAIFLTKSASSSGAILTNYLPLCVMKLVELIYQIFQ